MITKFCITRLPFIRMRYDLSFRIAINLTWEELKSTTYPVDVPASNFTKLQERGLSVWSRSNRAPNNRFYHPPAQTAHVWAVVAYLTFWTFFVAAIFPVEVFEKLPPVLRVKHIWLSSEYCFAFKQCFFFWGETSFYTFACTIFWILNFL